MIIIRFYDSSKPRFRTDQIIFQHIVWLWGLIWLSDTELIQLFGESKVVQSSTVKSGTEAGQHVNFTFSIGLISFRWSNTGKYRLNVFLISWIAANSTQILHGTLSKPNLKSPQRYYQLHRKSITFRLEIKSFNLLHNLITWFECD